MMMRTMTICGFLALAAIAAAGCGGQGASSEGMAVELDQPAETVETAQTAEIEVRNAQVNCPVMGNPVDKAVFVDHGDKRVYFCCPPCIEKFNQDPDGYIKKMEDEGITLAMAGGLENDHDDEHGHDDGGAGGGHDHDHGAGDHAGHDHG